MSQFYSTRAAAERALSHSVLRAIERIEPTERPTVDWDAPCSESRVRIENGFHIVADNRRK